MIQRLVEWLERRWVAPAYSGWLVLGLALFFFAAATNTLAGWLYVISGVMLALAAIAAIGAARSLRGMQVKRYPIQPVSAGEAIAIELAIENTTTRPKTLIQVQDTLPYVLGKPVQRAIDTIPANSAYVWQYEQPTSRRGVYRWQTVQLRTAAPLGLVWCRRDHAVLAKAVVYPTVLPLTQCPIVDQMGRDTSRSVQSLHSAYGATEGITRTLRPYRWGDSTRLIHWRTSARYGELRVRELEVFTGGQELVICLDVVPAWTSIAFEQAVVAAASLYFYALRQQLRVSLWTAATGQLRGDRAVLEALAAIAPNDMATEPPSLPLLWLTTHELPTTPLPAGSRWILWSADATASHSPAFQPGGIAIQADQPLQLQLQGSLQG